MPPGGIPLHTNSRRLRHAVHLHAPPRALSLLHALGFVRRRWPRNLEHGLHPDRGPQPGQRTIGAKRVRTRARPVPAGVPVQPECCTNRKSAQSVELDPYEGLRRGTTVDRMTSGHEPMITGICDPALTVDWVTSD